MIHVGHLVLGLSTGTVEGYLATFVYLVVYIFLQLFVYIFILSFYTNEEGHMSFLDNISNIRNLYKSSKWFTVCFISIILSMSGLPFFAGFFLK
jgi:NADH:ubiquinone oxidoreductase subunit 2 (subunit N)